MANEKQVIDLPGTRVDTLWITVESGTNEDGTAYEKRQQTAPKTFERCVTDDDGKNLSEKLSEMQTQINGATSDVAGAVNEIIDERLETSLASKAELESVSEKQSSTKENGGRISGTNWYRIFEFSALKSTQHFVLSVEREFSSQAEESYIYDVILTYRGEIEAVLINSEVKTKLIDKFRLVYKSVNQPYYIDVYYSGTDANDIKTRIFNFTKDVNEVKNISYGLADIPEGYKITEYNIEKISAKDKISQLSNPNILINPNFKINQRGIRTLTTTDGTQKYTVDRWKTFQASTNSITITTALSTGKPSGITLRASNECWVLGQYTENFADYAGKTVTVSVKIKSMTGRWRVFVSDTDSNYHIFDFWNVADGIIKGTCTIGANPTRLLTCFHFLGSVSPGGEVTPTGSGEISVEWIKLEVGDTATAYMPPEPATELAKCQRYYFDSGYIYYDFPREIMELFFPVTMRAIPTVYVGGEEYEINGEYVSSFLLTENECTYLNKSGIRTNLGYTVSGSWLCDGLSADAEIH